MLISILEFHFHNSLDSNFWSNLGSSSTAAIIGSVIGGLFLWSITKDQIKAANKSANAALESVEHQKTMIAHEKEAWTQEAKKRTIELIQPLILDISNNTRLLVEKLTSTPILIQEIDRFRASDDKSINYFQNASHFNLIVEIVKDLSLDILPHLDRLEIIASMIKEEVIDIELFNSIYLGKFKGEVQTHELLILALREANNNHRLYYKTLEVAFPERYQVAS